MPGSRAKQRVMPRPTLRVAQQQISVQPLQETLLAGAPWRWVSLPTLDLPHPPPYNQSVHMTLHALYDVGVSSSFSSHCAQAFHAAGWTREAVLNVPNALSMGRLISGPVIAYLILEGHWAAAMGTLTVAGACSFPFKIQPISSKVGKW